MIGEALRSGLKRRIAVVRRERSTRHRDYAKLRCRQCIVRRLQLAARIRAERAAFSSIVTPPLL
jgi:hypothetical protein